MPNPLSAPSRSYISQLDALRFFAAFITAAFHADVMKLLFHSPDRPIERDWSHTGSNCVTFFFVLSGFVITWLLLRERDRSETVDVVAFYLRRVFRIWPLYYLIILSGLFIIPNMPGLFLPDMIYSNMVGLDFPGLLMWLTFFPNLGTVEVIVPQQLILHTWSIGMEEQFYAVWPWLVKKMRRPQVAMVGIILVFAVLRFVFFPMMPTRSFSKWLEFFRFDCMAMGGLVAVYYHSGRWKTQLAFLQSPALLYSVAMASLVLTLAPDPLYKTYYVPLLSGVYGLLILALALQPTRMTWLNHSGLRYLGAISYGIYMYNIIACLVSINIMQRIGHGSFTLFLTAPVAANVFYYALCLGLTIGLSALSYRFIETPFLRLKDRLAQPKQLQAV